jgi:hypothetical protein
MGMIHKINLICVPLQLEDHLFNIDRKKQRKKGCFTCGEKGYFKDRCPTIVEPKKERSKGKALTSVKTWDDSSREDKPPRTRSHRSSSRSSHKCLMARGKMSIPPERVLPTSVVACLLCLDWPLSEVPDALA